MKAKSGSTRSLLNEHQVTLTEDDVVVCVAYVESEAAAQKMLEEWKAGTYQLLRD